ncbi:unnamed protein product [marine sediment metagenome]|uniref:Type IX secretion system protein PorV domain-containing protein n=1 Tax=marine sediment metagenome TaxID=412755 RepID=X1FQM1_9ZZZZ
MKIIRLLLTIVSLCLFIQTAYAQVGTTGLQFLQIGVGARACGMGEAFSSLSDDASGIYWNPAGLVLVEQKEFLFMHNEWLEGTRYEFLSGIIHLSKLGSFGVALTYFDYGEMEGRDEFGHHMVDFSAYDFALSLSYSRKIKDDFSAGITGKIIQSKIETESGTGFAGDIGVLYQGPFNGLQIGFVLQHFGTGLKYVDEVTKLPMTVRGGISYTLPLNMINLIPAVDVLKELDADYKTNIGLEANLMNRIALRGGYKVKSSQGGMTAGLGIVQKISFFQLKIDYAYGGYGDLGNSHRVSLGVAF